MSLVYKWMFLPSRLFSCRTGTLTILVSDHSHPLRHLADKLLSLIRPALTGGMLKAIRMIREAKKAKGFDDASLVVDVHPSRPDYRGFFIGENIVSLEADPTFDSLMEAGATVVKRSDAHTVLDNMFLVSGEIPRVTPYEQGLHGALQFNGSDQEWFTDEKIEDERFLMCNLKGKPTHPTSKS